MNKESDKNTPTPMPDEKEKNESGKKYNFYRKPPIKKKAPEVKQTLTSYKRMLKANPLLKYELEGKDWSMTGSRQLLGSSNDLNKAKGNGKPPPEKHSLQPNYNSGKPLITNLQRSKSVRLPPKSHPLSKGIACIISGNKPKNTNSGDLSRKSPVDFNTSTSTVLSSTRLEKPIKLQNKKETVVKPKPTTKVIMKTSSKTKKATQDNSISSNGNSTAANRKDRDKKTKPLRRSLSAQHFDRKKRQLMGVSSTKPHQCYHQVEHTQSLEDVSTIIPIAILPHEISPIAEGSRETSIIFKTPSAYERRSVARFTPRSTISSRRSIYHLTTPLPSLMDLEKRLNDWLVKRGKSLSSFHHLKCFGIEQDGTITKPIDEENKENIEVEHDLDRSSYEDLRITISQSNRPEKPVVLNEENAECVARGALEDLLKLIQEGYSRQQCEGWLGSIRQRYPKVEEEAQYWECRAAIEQARGNISNAVQCYKTAIVQGAEIQAVDESLDVLLQKFSLLNISTDKIEDEKSVRERARIVQDARNIFKSSIIQFAVQERKLKKNNKQEDQLKFVATPVRRSTRLSRSAYTSTPGIKICSSLQELDTGDRNLLDFKKNGALV
ncbi:hypothetical protein NQ317_019922 [Molorchus minor]|uniref:Cytoskeleton-associated protein 2 C-terminal domain-containing protein n=1 Tax=Molorchus minor TaxID=1323400 RepID=A0ABQ9K6R4_9CUCU|nr:hypothetical protein NQ317_019922 [Molorchus minor]